MIKLSVWVLVAVVFVLSPTPRLFSQEMTAKEFLDEAIALIGSPLPAEAGNAQTRPTRTQRQMELQGMKMGIAPLPYPPKPGWFSFKSNIGLVDCTVDEAYRNRPIQRLQVYFEYRDDYEAVADYLSQAGWASKSTGVYEKDGIRASRDNFTMGHDTLIFERFTPMQDKSAPGGFRISPSSPKEGTDGGGNAGSVPSGGPGEEPFDCDLCNDSARALSSQCMACRGVKDLGGSASSAPPSYPAPNSWGEGASSGVPVPFQNPLTQINPFSGGGGNTIQRQETRRQCPDCKGSGRSRTWKDYPPVFNGMVGKKEWCDLCGDFGRPHSHKACPACKGLGYVRY